MWCLLSRAVPSLILQPASDAVALRMATVRLPVSCSQRSTWSVHIVCCPRPVAHHHITVMWDLRSLLYYSRLRSLLLQQNHTVAPWQAASGWHH